jgi:hypothetical protein
LGVKQRIKNSSLLDYSYIPYSLVSNIELRSNFNIIAGILA